MLWPLVVILARVLGEPDLPVPEVEDHAVFLLKRHDVMVGCAPDGMPGDAGVDAPLDDAANDAAIDAPDGGMPADAGVSPDAGACYTIEGDAITMIVKPSLEIDASTGTRFAMLFVTPSRPFVEAIPDPFPMLEQRTAPVIVTKEVEIEDPSLGRVCGDGCGGAGPSGGGCAPAAEPWNPPGVGSNDTTPGDSGVPFEMIGPYQVLRVQPADRAELVGWLEQAGFDYAADDVDAVVPYIARGYHVVAVRLAVAQSSEVPLSLTWAGSELRLPLALAAARFVGATLTVYIAADGSYAFAPAAFAFSELIGYDNAGYVSKQYYTIPAIASPDEDPVAVRQVPDVHFHQTIEKTVEVRVPVSVSCYDDDGGCCSDCSSHRRVRFDWVVLVVAVTLVVRRRRRR